MKLTDYAAYFESRGIAIPPRLLDRHKKALYHSRITEEYLARRLDEDDDWWSKVIESSEEYERLVKMALQVTNIIGQAKKSLNGVLELEDEKDRVPQLAKWMSGWLNKAGMARIRNALNSQLNTRTHTKEDRLVRIPVLSSTRDKVSKLIDVTHGDVSYDEMLSRVISFYCHMNAITLPEGEPKYKHRKKAGR